MDRFFAEVTKQRWDDHRFYHQSYVNQTLHFISACSFVATYVLLFTAPVFGVLFGWIFSMCSRQIGHFFFEPKGYDAVNQKTYEYKEEVKPGFNIARKIVLLTVWALSPLVLVWQPTLFGTLPAWTEVDSFLSNLAALWLGLAGAAWIGRSLYLAATRGPLTGAAWCYKILTDPFHDIWMYYRAPFHLMQGKRFDPLHDDPRDPLVQARQRNPQMQAA